MNCAKVQCENISIIYNMWYIRSPHNLLLIDSQAYLTKILIHKHDDVGVKALLDFNKKQQRGFQNASN